MTGPGRYSFDYGAVHIIVLSSEHVQEEQVPQPLARVPLPSAAHNNTLHPQVSFFVKDMAALQRHVTPWVIVTLHRPPFVSMPRDDLDIELARVWHRLFVQYEIDFVVRRPEAQRALAWRAISSVLTRFR